MKVPDFQCLVSKKDCNETNNHWFRISFASGMHRSPYWYKYYYWVFNKKSPVDGREFLSDKYRLCVHDAMKLIEELNKNDEGYWLYNVQLPRNDPSSPFDLNHKKWSQCEIAPAYADDNDPVYISKDGIPYK